MSRPTEIYLIRHCEARGNVDRIFQGHTDAQISEKGIRQLEKLRERFADIHLDALYSSPLLRAKLTAKAVLGDKPLEIRIDKRIIEINGGVLEGKKWSDFPKLYKKQAEQWDLRPWMFEMQEGESMRSVYARMKEFLEETAREHQGEAVAVCSHGCAIRNALCYVKGYPIERLSDIEWCDNTAVSLLRLENGQWTVVYENNISHLEESLSTFAGQSWWKKDKGGSMSFE